MKHLHALLLVLTCLLVSAAWCFPPASGSGPLLDQVVHLQHQEAAAPAALGQYRLDLVEVSPVDGVGVQGTSLAVERYHGDQVDRVVPSSVVEEPLRAASSWLSAASLNCHRRPVQAAVNPHSMTAARSTHLAMSPALGKVVRHLRCPSGGTTTSILPATHSSNSGA